MNYLVNIDLKQNQLLNAVIHVLGGDPGSPVEGQIYYNSAIHKLKYRDNAGWQTLLDGSTGVQSVGASSPLSSTGGTTPVISIGSTIGVSLGGTGASSFNAYGIVIAGATGTAALSSTVLAAGQVLVGTTATAPVATTISGESNRIAVTSVSGSITISLNATQFPQATIANTVLVSSAANTASWGTVPVAAGGTGQTSLTIHGILLGQGTNGITSAVLTNGQVLIGSTGNDPVASTITGEANRIGVSNGAGSITLSLNSTQWPQAILANAGKALISSGADTAAWGTLGISGGGTGKTSWTLYSFLYGNGTSAPVEIGPLTNGQIIVGSTGVAPVAATITGTANRLGVSNGAGSITLNVDTNQFPQALLGDASKALIATGANTAAWGTLSVAGGGTGQVTLTQYGVVIGNGTSAVHITAAGTTGQVLMATTGANPAFTSSGGDISGAFNNMTVNTVGGASSSNIADAVSKRHTQNTDTGTTSATFQLASGASGVKLKDVSGVLYIRNAADGAEADLVARDATFRNLLVTGTMTVIHTEHLSVGDQFISLNEDITAAAQNADGGISITRLAATTNINNCANNGSGLIRVTSASHTLETNDYVRINGVTGTTEANNTAQNPAWKVTKIDANTFDLVSSTFTNAYVSDGTAAKRIDGTVAWDEGSGRFEQRVGADSAPVTKFFALKYVPAPIGDGIALSYNIVHNLGTKDVVVDVREAASPYNTVVADVERSDDNTVVIKFASAPASSSKVVTVIG